MSTTRKVLAKGRVSSAVVITPSGRIAKRVLPEQLAGLPKKEGAATLSIEIASQEMTGVRLTQQQWIAAARELRERAQLIENRALRLTLPSDRPPKTPLAIVKGTKAVG